MKFYFSKYKEYSQRSFTNNSNIYDLLNNIVSSGEYLILNNRNFKEKDGINSQVTIAANSDDPYTLDELKTYTYLVIYEDTVIPNYWQSWYIMDYEIRSTNNITFNLYRDILSDNFNDIVEAQGIVYNGYVDNYNPLIVNEEPISVNQILKERKKLYDASDTSWICMFMKPHLYTNNENIVEKSLYTKPGIPIYTSLNYLTSIHATGTNTNFSGKLYNMPFINFRIRIRDIQGLVETYEVSISKTSYEVRGTSSLKYDILINVRLGFFETFRKRANEIAQILQNSLYNDSSLNNLIDTQLDIANKNIVMNNKVYIDASLYKSNYNINNNLNDDEYDVNTYSLKTDFEDFIFNSLDETRYSDITTQTDLSKFEAKINYKYYSVSGSNSLIELSDLKMNIKADNNALTVDGEEYCILAFPYGNNKTQVFSGTGNVNNDEYNIKMLSKLATQINSDVYSVNILPYCPFDLLANGQVDSSVLSSGGYNRIVHITDGNEDTIYSTGAYVLKKEYERIISYTESYSIPKENSITRKMRLMNEQYSSSFEFSPTKNRGVNNFKVKFEYNPVNCFIHIAPMWNWLYGINVDDNRGLNYLSNNIINYSSNALIDYKYNNKNYQAIFDRQIKTMDLQRKWQHAGGIVGIATSGASGAANGAIMGANAGPYGALAGGIVGGVAGVAGGAADAIMNEKLALDQKELMISQHNMQIGNIQALADTLVQMDNTSVINTLVPILEIYDCTDEEKELVDFYIEDNGYTLNARGWIKDYMNEHWFLRCQITATKYLKEDTHAINTIQKELGIGVYYNGHI